MEPKPHDPAQDVDAGTAPGASRRNVWIAITAAAGIALHLVLRFGVAGAAVTKWGVYQYDAPLVVVLALGGIPLISELVRKTFRREFGADLIAGISIVTSAVLGEYLAGALVVLMLSGGEALEAYAVASAGSVLTSLARRMPSVAHRRIDGTQADVSLTEIAVGDQVLVYPHETCPVDGTVVEGHGVMDESYLTGEPYTISKAPGAQVLSGAINGEAALSIRADRRAVDSRYTQIMQVMRASEQSRPHLRRLGDQLGALYTPLAVMLALAAWGINRDPLRFLAVMVVATPCPLLIAIPVAIIGAISLAARRGIIVKDPAVLERVDSCRTAIFDKTGTLTCGQPKLTEVLVVPGMTPLDVISLVAGVERYSKHPLALAVMDAAEERRIVLHEAAEISERPGEGLRGIVNGHQVQVTSRKKLLEQQELQNAPLPAEGGGLECVVVIDGHYAATLRFRDEPRREGAAFVTHLKPRHQFRRMLLVSGDRESEVRYLAERVGITEVFAGQSPEQKLEIVRRESAQAATLYMGDGINDAPALTAATVGLAFGKASEVTFAAAGAVILDTSLEKVDEFLHISRRMRTIALQSAVGGMALSGVGMLLAATGWLSPVAGAIIQEVIDVLAVLNALRMALPPREMTDYD